MVQEIEREIGTVAVGDGDHSIKRVPEAALQFLMRASAPMKQEGEIDRLRNPGPVKFLITVESGFVKADNCGFHDALLYLLYGWGSILLCLVYPVDEGALAYFKREHLLEETLYAAVWEKHHHAQVDNQRLYRCIIDHGIGTALAGGM